MFLSFKHKKRKVSNVNKTELNWTILATMQNIFGHFLEKYLATLGTNKFRALHIKPNKNK